MGIPAVKDVAQSECAAPLMKLSVIIPCYNEVRTIAQLVAAVERAPWPHKEIVLVDDCSSDGTREKIAREIEPRGIKAIYHDRNRGKGAAIRSGVAAATGEIVIIQDADLEYDPNEIAKVIAPIVEDRADVVFGSRFGGERGALAYSWQRAVNAFLTALSNLFTRLDLTDMECGYKAFRREVLEAIQLEEDRFGFEPEVTAKVARLKCRVDQVGVRYQGRTYAEGKKIGWLDGAAALLCILKYNLPRPSRR
jgi:glycosyltransferase involved in cell wall biosynthesis